MENNKTGMIAMSVGLLLIGLIAGYFIGKSMSPSNITYQTATPTVSSEMSDWKTYTSPQYGFELKHPNAASVLEQPAPAGSESYSVEVHYDKNNNSYEPTRLIISNVPDSRNGLKLTNTNTFSSSTADMNGEHYIHFTLNNSDIYANCLYTKDQEVSNFCNQIISTFRFTN